MKIESVPISKVKINPDNPRVIRDERFAKLVQSVREFPKMLEIRPIVVNDAMVVLGGNMRLRACKEAGLKQVYIIRASELTEEEQRRFIIADNVGFGEHDWDMLANEWDAAELAEWGLEVPTFEVEPEPEDLIGESKDKPATLKITFPSPADLQKCESKIQEVINRICPDAFYSVSAGEI